MGENDVLTNRADIVEKAFVSSCHFSLSNDSQQINTCSLGRVFGLKHFSRAGPNCLLLHVHSIPCTSLSSYIGWSQEGIVGDYTVAGTNKAALCRCSNRNQE